jgi:hypothetical protein
MKTFLINGQNVSEETFYFTKNLVNDLMNKQVSDISPWIDENDKNYNIVYDFYETSCDNKEFLAHMIKFSIIN